MKNLKTFLSVIAISVSGLGAFAQGTPPLPPPPPPPPVKAVDVAPQAPAGDVIEITTKLPYNSTFLAAVKAADMTDSLKTKSPITVFAPSNNAFAKLPAGTVENLLKPENKAALASLLNYHVVAGSFSLKQIIGAAIKAKGTTTLTTVTGGILTLAFADGKVTITDEKGGVSGITLSDLPASNGLVHVTDSVLMPK